MTIRQFSLPALLATLSVLGCGGGGDSRPPGDAFFRTVLAGSDTSAAADIIIYDQSNASKRTPGSPGSDPSVALAQAKVYLPNGETVILTGTHTGNSYTVTGDGWTLMGTMAGNGTDGTFMSPDGDEGRFSGENAAAGQVGRFCGTYDGDGAGTWNFVVSETGALAGSFSGDADGSLDGHASANSVSMQWSGESFGDTGGGQAKGTISNGTITGTWMGTLGDPVSGTWTSDQSCPGPQESPMSSVPEDSCPCTNGRVIPPSGACCGSGVCCGSIS